ncbi:MAG: N-6 DNA methylase [Gammaproteobacteria bacterium]|nr:N-6 DNA methylase [Gammaproteobacteria bacterium]
MNNKIITALMDVMQGTEDLPASHERALQILAWTSLGERREIGQDLSPEVALDADDTHLSEMIEALANQNSVCRHAFSSLLTLKKHLFIPLRAGLRQCLKMQSQGLLLGLGAADLAVPGLSRWDDFGMPPEVADLLMGLEPDLGQSIYVAWDGSGQLTARALKKGARVHSDIQMAPAIACLSGLIVGGQLTVEHTDPIRMPGSVAHGKLTKFDSAIAFPPIGLRYEPETAERDLFERFPEKTTLSSVLSLRHLMAVAKSRVLVCVPNGFLFGTNADYELRKSLVEKGQLRAVIALPPGLLASASIGISMLVISPQGGQRTVRMVNADDDRFRRMTSKTRSQLTRVDAIIDATNGRPDDTLARDVPIVEITANDYQLQVARYLIPVEQKRVLALLDNAELVSLGDQTEIIRPPVVKSKGKTSVLLREIGVADLPSYGYIEQPQKRIEVDEEVAKKLGRHHLQPLDIVLTIKGSVGKVGLVPDSLKTSDLPWVVGQSSVALRMTSPHINPKALFMLLRSGLGQALMKGIVSAGTMSFIQTRELEAMAVPVPSMAEQAVAAEVLEKEACLQREIRGLQTQLAQLSQALWSV